MTDEGLAIPEVDKKRLPGSMDEVLILGQDDLLGCMMYCVAKDRHAKDEGGPKIARPSYSLSGHPMAASMGRE